MEAVIRFRCATATAADTTTTTAEEEATAEVVTAEVVTAEVVTAEEVTAEATGVATVVVTVSFMTTERIGFIFYSSFSFNSFMFCSIVLPGFGGVHLPPSHKTRILLIWV